MHNATVMHVNTDDDGGVTVVNAMNLINKHCTNSYEV